MYIVYFYAFHKLISVHLFPQVCKLQFTCIISSLIVDNEILVECFAIVLNTDYADLGYNYVLVE